jgi:hypothetical protein
MENEIEQFLKMGATYNTASGADELSEMDVDDAPFSAIDVVKTHEAASNFGVVRENYQIRAGMRRGDLFVADFGDFRLVAFTGEGIIRDAA